MTKKERAQYRARMKQEDKHSKELYALWHAFLRRFQQRQQWKYKGWEMMERVWDFAEKHRDVVVLRCDDDKHTSSMLVLIPHRRRSEWFGLTVVFVPQCTGEDPTCFFLYPCHLSTLVKCLNRFEAIQKKTPARRK